MRRYRRGLWLIGLLTLVVLFAVVLAELLLNPTKRSEWLHYAYILAGPAVVTGLLVPVLRRWVSSRASVAATVLFVGLCSLALGAITTSAASNAMFLSGHDYRLFLVVLGLSSGISLVVGWYLTRPLADDIAKLGRLAEEVAEGDLSARSGIHRSDEIGRTAAALDLMVSRLDEAERDRNDRLRTRQHLFTSVSHDLRTPLTAMRAAVEALEDGLAPDPARYFGVLHTQLDTVDNMIGQLVEWSRLESGHEHGARHRLAVSELVDECVEALGPLALRRGVRLNVDADGPAVVVGNSGELSRVLRNLVDNSLRFAPAESDIAIHVRDTNGAVQLDVIDRGPGFPADFRSVAFEPFRRADPSRNARTGNTGLGLAICRAVVESHGGEIRIIEADHGHISISLPKELTA